MLTVVPILGQSDNGCPQHIKLQTVTGWDVPNGIDGPLNLKKVEQARRYLKATLAYPTQLSGPSRRYNCHGLVFACRRVNIPLYQLACDASRIVTRILIEDGYCQVTCAPQVGDIAVYRDDDNEIEHTGFVSKIDKLTNVLSKTIIRWVWSMWGGLGEFEHTSGNTPYTQEPEYWRLRNEYQASAIK